MRVILFILGLAFSIDGLYCGYTGSMNIGEAIIVADGIFLLIWSSFYDAFKSKKFLRFIKTTFSVCMVVFIAYSCAICVVGIMDSDSANEDYAIVLGASLKDNEPGEVLQSRLDTAVKYLEGNREAKVIVSGARETYGGITEAGAMRNYLVARGIDDSRILLEESAFNTYENFLNSKDAVAGESCVYITSEFHVVRSAMLADICGIKQAAHIGAHTPWYQLPVCCARELLSQLYAFRYYFQ